MLSVISWNLLRLTGASLDEVVALIRRERPDVLLMQEATQRIDALPGRVGGYYARVPLPGRIHGLAAWSATAFAAPRVVALPAGSVVERVAQVIDVGPFTLANVHLSHGQLLNRRQLRAVARHLPPVAAVLGDYNLVGPALLPGFRDVGPREPTHRSLDLWPLRIDRCLIRGLVCRDARALPRASSDHHPIAVRLGQAGIDHRAGDDPDGIGRHISRRTGHTADDGRAGRKSRPIRLF